MSGPGPKWESKDVDVTSLFLIAALVIMGALLAALATGGLFRAMALHADRTERQPNALAGERQNFPAPRLQVSPAADFATYHAAQQHELDSYGWIDKSRGTLHMPIEHAMDLLLQRGLPQTPPAGTNVQFQQRAGVMTQ